MRRFRTSSHSPREFVNGRHRFEHWYRDNTVYFITAKCRDGFHAFASDEAKAVFWDRFTHWTGLTQCSRHKICSDNRDYPHTRMEIEAERGIARALELNAFLGEVRYPRYDRNA